MILKEEENTEKQVILYKEIHLTQVDYICFKHCKKKLLALILGFKCVFVHINWLNLRRKKTKFYWHNFFFLFFFFFFQVKSTHDTER